MSLNSHYLMPELYVKSFALANDHVPERHMAHTVQQHLKGFATKWNLPLQELPVYVATTYKVLHIA